MPITISVQQFKEDTKRRFFDRPLSLVMIDYTLGCYYQTRNLPNLMNHYYDCRFLIDDIEDWTKGKEIVVRGGVTRYLNPRDPKGTIKKLYDQAVITAGEVERAYRAQLDQKREAVEPAAAEAQRMQDFSNFGPVVNEASSVTDSLRAGSGRSFRPPSVASNNQRNSIVQGLVPVADRQGPTGGFSIQAFRAASELLQRVVYADISALDILDAATQNANLSPFNITLSDIMNGIKALGYGDRFTLAQHCTWGHVMTSIKGVTSNSPMLLAVGTDRPPFRAVVCYGVTRSFGNTSVYEVSDGQTPEGFCEMYEDGSFLRNFNSCIDDEILLPTIGYIKALR